MKQAIDQFLSRTPLQKAKDIAKVVGVTRKEVNSFLHDHPDRYEKDKEYRWRIIKDQELTLTLPNGWVTADDFETILLRAGPILDGSCQDITVAFSSGCKTMIDCIARLLALINQLVHFGKVVTVDFSSAEQTRTYLDRAGFFDHLDKKVIVLPERPSESAAIRHKGQSDTLVEFGHVDPSADNDALIDQLTNNFVQQSGDDYSVAAYTVFSELIGNVMEHSETPLYGFAGLQKYGGRRNHILTVISDSGVGIAETLRPALKKYYPSLYKKFGQRSLESDMGLVTVAMKEGRISRFGSEHGLGFHSSREQAIKFHAKFSVRQEYFCLEFEYKHGKLVKVRPRNNLTRLMGTHICFDFFVD